MPVSLTKPVKLAYGCAMMIYVDADACPVKEEITTVAIRHGCRAVMVCNGGIRPNPHPLIDLVIVDDGPDAADIWIAEACQANDVVVTNDIPGREERCCRCRGSAAGRQPDHEREYRRDTGDT